VCKECGSGNQREFVAETNIHTSTRKNLEKVAVLVFPEVLVCLDCGFTEFILAETDLRLLGGNAA
jgi:predicted nucleic-acid-binding Zn-ribbon protein